MSLVASSLITLADSAMNGISADEQNEKSTYSLPANQMLAGSGRSLLRVPGTAAGACVYSDMYYISPSHPAGSYQFYHWNRQFSRLS
jgi:hypothetical protein